MAKGAGSRNCSTRSPMEILDDGAVVHADRTRKKVPVCTSLDVQSVIAAVSALRLNNQVKVGGAYVRRKRTSWIVSVPGMPPIKTMSKDEAARNAIGANQVQTPGIPGSLSRVDEGRVVGLTNKLGLLEATDQQLETLADQHLERSRRGEGSPLRGIAISREMQRRKDLARQSVWERERQAREDARRQEWETMLADTSPATRRADAVRAAYTDGTSQLTMHRRFDAEDWSEAHQAIQAIDSYNDFDARKLSKALEPFEGRLDGLIVGREMSPVLYARLPQNLSVTERRDLGKAWLQAMGKARGDELSFVDAEGTHHWDFDQFDGDTTLVRAWWD